MANPLLAGIQGQQSNNPLLSGLTSRTPASPFASIGSQLGSFNQVANSTPATVPTRQSVLRSTANLVSNFTPADGQSLGNFFTETARALPSSAATVSDAVGRGAIALSQGVWRSTLPTGRFIANLNPMNRVDSSLRIDPFVAQTQFEEDLTGSYNRAPLTLTRAGREFNPFVDPDAQSGAVGSVLYPALGLFAGTADLIGGGGKSISTLARNLRYVDDASTVTTLLRAEGITEQAAREVAPIIANSRSLLDIEQAINRARIQSQAGQNFNDVDREIAAGNVRVVSRDGMETYQYRRDGKWITAPTDEEAVARFRRTSEGLPPTERVEIVPDYIQEMREAANMARDAISNMPGRELIRYVSRTTGELPEMTGRATMKSLTGSGKTVKTGKWQQRGDVIFDEIMPYSRGGSLDMSEAQDLIDQYRAAKAQLDEMVRAEREATRAWRAERASSRNNNRRTNNALTTGQSDIQGSSVQPPQLTRELRNTQAQESLSSDRQGLASSGGRQEKGLPLQDQSQQRMGEMATSRTADEAELQSLQELSERQREVRQLAQTLRDPSPSKVSIPSLEETLVRFNTSVKEKVHIFNKLNTPNRVLQKIGFGEEAKALRKAYDAYLKELPKNIDKIADWRKRVPNPESSVRIFKYLDGQDVELSPLEKEVAGEIRAWLNQWADRLGLPADKRVTNYITRLFDEGEGVSGEFDEDIAKIIADRLPSTVYDPFVEKRLGKKGYRENVWDALDAYVKRGTRKVHMEPVLERIQGSAGAELPTSPIEESQWRYLKDYVDRIQKRPTPNEKSVDNFLQLLGINKARPVARGLRILRKLTYLAILAFRPAMAILNLSQGVNTYAKLGEKYTALGYMALVRKSSWREAEELGLFTNGFIEDRSYNAVQRLFQKVETAGFLMFDFADKVNRVAAYQGGKTKALAEGKSLEEAVEYGKDLVAKTQFLYDAVDTPVGMSSEMMKTLTQFMSYMVKQSEFLLELKDVPNKKEVMKAYARYAAGSAAFVYTIGQAMGMELEDMLPLNTETFGRFSGGYIPPSLKPWWELGKALSNQPDKFGNERDASDKFSDTAKAFLGYVPGGSQIKNTYQGIQAATQGGSFTSDGKLQFEVGTSPLETAQLVVFGKNVTDQAQRYFDKEATPFEKEMARTYDQVQQLAAENRIDEAQKIVDGLTEEQYEQYKVEKRKFQTEKTNAGKKAILPIYQEVQQLAEQGRTDEALEIVNGLSDEQYRYYQLVKEQVKRDEAAANGEAPTFADGEALTPQSLVGTIVLYARAIGTDPVVAFDALFTKDKLRYVSGNAVVVERMPLTGDDGSAKVADELAKEQGVDRDTMRLDHFIPLQLGGDNSRGNLRLVPTEVHAQSTPIENALGQAVREERMSAREARTLIKDFKEGRVSADEVLQKIPAPTSRRDDGPSLLATLTGAQTAEAFDGVATPRVGIMDVLREVPGVIKRGVQAVNNFMTPKTVGEANASGGIPIGIDPREWAKLPDDAPVPEGVKFFDATGGVGSLQKVGGKVATKAFAGFSDLSTKILDDLKGKSVVAKQYILDATNRGDIKQPERELFRELVAEEGDKIDVQTFAEKVKANLLPLERMSLSETADDGMGFSSTRYENINLPDELRGPVADYDEHIYRSPVRTKAGQVHFGDADPGDYFGHTRVEDLPNGTRRVIEVQSDLFQKGRLEQEVPDQVEVSIGDRKYQVSRNRFGKDGFTKNFTDFDVDADGTYTTTRNFMSGNGVGVESLDDAPFTASEAKAAAAEAQKALEVRRDDLSGKLEPYRNTWHERVIREELKKAAEDGKTKLQLPTGETAMKIEGLGSNVPDFMIGEGASARTLTPQNLKVGEKIEGNHGTFIITEVLGDGKFRAMSKDWGSNRNMEVEDIGKVRQFLAGNGSLDSLSPEARKMIDSATETFDISGKVDTENPIYKFYEKTVGKYLTNKFGAKRVTDPQGVEWWEVPVSKDQADKPVLAYGKANPYLVAGVAATGAAAVGVGAYMSGEKASTSEIERAQAQDTTTLSSSQYKPFTKVTLPSGWEVYTPPSEYRGHLEAAYKKYPAIPRGMLEAILMKESSMGTNDNNYNPTIGEKAWLLGLTNIAKKDLEKRAKYKADYNSTGGAIEAAAAYLNLRMKPGMSAEDLYFDRYYTQEVDTAERRARLREMIDFYAQ